MTTSRRVEYLTSSTLPQVIDSVCGHLPLTERTALALKLRSLCGGMAKEKVCAEVVASFCCPHLGRGLHGVMGQFLLQVDQLCLHHKPAVKVFPQSVSIGRTDLPRLSDKATPKLI